MKTISSSEFNIILTKKTKSLLSDTNIPNDIMIKKYQKERNKLLDLYFIKSY